QGSQPTRVIKEFARESADEDMKPGQTVGVDVFENVKYVDVTGISKGKGFTGTVKRYNFHLGRATHGNTNYRERGSLGAGTYPARVVPGLKMAGHQGASQVTVKGLEVIGFDKEAGLIYVKGAVPGRSRGIVFVRKSNGKKS
ncbi:MAG: 50S ribosomal protein L3, partial [Chitinivibrionales bacterium]|nr:50S ribosomal protein L3 [Chitinivibrionales bacterium]MBD3396949.1 50S ribosomal protein L3 [Chitinivibrionales bacterium]